jgi:hypothetical protein
MGTYLCTDWQPLYLRSGTAVGVRYRVEVICLTRGIDADKTGHPPTSSHRSLCIHPAPTLLLTCYTLQRSGIASMAITRHNHRLHQVVNSQRLRSGAFVPRPHVSQFARSSSDRIQKHPPRLRARGQLNSRNQIPSSKQLHVQTGVQYCGDGAEPELSDVPQPESSPSRVCSLPLSSPTSPESAMSEETVILTQPIEEEQDHTPPTVTATTTGTKDPSINFEKIGLPVDGF